MPFSITFKKFETVARSLLSNNLHIIVIDDII